MFIFGTIQFSKICTKSLSVEKMTKVSAKNSSFWGAENDTGNHTGNHTGNDPGNHTGNHTGNEPEMRREKKNFFR